MTSLHATTVSALDRASTILVLIMSLLAGAALGAIARLWMRFISTHQEFSWTGTGFIVIGFSVLFTGQAGVYLARRGNTGTVGFYVARIAAIATMLPLAGAAGAFAFPIIVFTPLAVVRTAWSRWLRILLGVLALAAALFVIATLLADLPMARAIIGAVWFVAIYLMLAWVASFSLASRNDERFTNRPTTP